MTISTLIFDVDGVLVPGHKFADALLCDYNLDRQQTAAFFAHDFHKCLIGETDLKTAIAPHLSNWQWPGTVDEFLEYWFQTEHTLNESLVEFIQAQRKRGVACYAATNQEKYRTQYLLDHMGLNYIFNDVFASTNLGHIKPDLDFFKAIDKKIPLEKTQTLFWDDLPQNTAAAHNFGWHAEVFTDNQSFQMIMQEKYTLLLDTE